MRKKGQKRGRSRSERGVAVGHGKKAPVGEGTKGNEWEGERESVEEFRSSRTTTARVTKTVLVLCFVYWKEQRLILGQVTVFPAGGLAKEVMRGERNKFQSQGATHTGLPNGGGYTLG